MEYGLLIALIGGVLCLGIGAAVKQVFGQTIQCFVATLQSGTGASCPGGTTTSGGGGGGSGGTGGDLSGSDPSPSASPSPSPTVTPDATPTDTPTG